MEKTFEMMRKIKAVLPEEKRGRVFCENDGHPLKILILNCVDGSNSKNEKVSKADIAKIEALDFVEGVYANKGHEEELIVKVSVN